MFLRGAAVTVWVSWLALLLGALVGAIVGMARTSRYIPLQACAVAYTELFRSIPILVLLFFVYFGIPLVMRVNLSPFAAVNRGLDAGGEFVHGGGRSGGDRERGEGAVGGGFLLGDAGRARGPETAGCEFRCTSYNDEDDVGPVLGALIADAVEGKPNGYLRCFGWRTFVAGTTGTEASRYRGHT